MVEDESVFTKLEEMGDQTDFGYSKESVALPANQSKASVTPGSKVIIKKEALKQLQKSTAIDLKPIEISINSPSYLFDSIQQIAVKASMLESQLSRNRKSLGFYVQRINDKFKSTDWILKDLLHSQSLFKGEENEASKYESVLNETILDYGPTGKPRFQDLIDVPSNYDMEEEGEIEDDSIVNQVNMNTFNQIERSGESFLGESGNDDTFRLSKDTVPKSKMSSTPRESSKVVLS